MASLTFGGTPVISKGLALPSSPMMFTRPSMAPIARFANKESESSNAARCSSDCLTESDVASLGAKPMALPSFITWASTFLPSHIVRSRVLFSEMGGLT